MDGWLERIIDGNSSSPTLCTEKGCRYYVLPPHQRDSICERTGCHLYKKSGQMMDGDMVYHDIYHMHLQLLGGKQDVELPDPYYTMIGLLRTKLIQRMVGQMMGVKVK